MKEYEGFFVDEELNIYNKKGMKITPFLGTDGYMHIRRRLPDGKYKYMRAHRLYAILFIPKDVFGLYLGAVILYSILIFCFLVVNKLFTNTRTYEQA